jgi:hypothetical protein
MRTDGITVACVGIREDRDLHLSQAPAAAVLPKMLKQSAHRLSRVRSGQPFG